MGRKGASRSAPRAPDPTHLAIPVRSLARSLRFYRGVLGMRVAWRGEGMADLRGGSVRSAFDLTLAADARADGRATPIHFGWRLPSARRVARFEARLRGAGVRIEGRRDEPGGGLGIYFRDPDGYELEIYAEAR